MNYHYRFKSFILGTLLGVLLTFSYGFTGTVGKIKVHFMPVTFVVDGVETHVGGSKVFTYNDSLYIPLRFASEILDKPITWNSSNRSIWMGQQPPGTFVYLQDLKVLRTQGDAWEVSDKWNKKEGGEPLKIAGRTFARGWYQRFWETSSKAREKEFLLNENFSRMEGYFGIDDYTINTPNKASCKIFADDEEVFAIDDVKGGSEAVFFQVYLTGKKRLKFYVETYGESRDPVCVDFADVKLFYNSVK